MCGIFGYLGDGHAIQIALDGLKKLEYRGYDSAGLACVQDRQISVWKAVGKISEMEKIIPKDPLQCGNVIAHTRWATHGIPSERNAHPHFDPTKSVAVVHNGIIENYLSLREPFREHYLSDTDTEVIVHLFSQFYQGDFLEAAVKTFDRLEGSFALALIHKNHPDTLIISAEQSPMVVGYSPETEELFVASDPHALSGRRLQIFYLQNREIALLEKKRPPRFLNKMGVPIVLKPYSQNLLYEAQSSENFEHFMLKEIYEQGERMKDAMDGRIDINSCSVYFEELSKTDLSRFKQIILVACGTSWHAAFYSAYLIEALAHIPAKAEIASEFRYRNPVILPDTLVIVMSQSGETADTLAELREAKQKGAFVLAICNVAQSSIDREADATLLIRSGPEVAVASTKTFTCQMVVMALFALMLARQREMTKQQSRILLEGICELPAKITFLLSNASSLEKLAQKYASLSEFFFLGRTFLYPIALEAALKLREIAYVDATGYPAGEMKHGPIAFLNEHVPSIIFCADTLLQKKIMSNLMECKARKAPIIAFAWEEFVHELTPHCEDIVLIPKTHPLLSAFPIAVASQLFAYFFAKIRKTDIDQPRNLAKSVTVE